MTPNDIAAAAASHGGFDDRRAVNLLVALWRHLGDDQVAEFVEDKTTLSLLHEFGIDYAQGNYLGKPDLNLPTSDNKVIAFTKPA